MQCDPIVLHRELYYTERTQLQYNSPSKIGAPRQCATYSMLGNILFCLTLLLRVGKNIILNVILTSVSLTKLTLKLTLVTLQATSDILDSISESCGFLRSSRNYLRHSTNNSRSDRNIYTYKHQSVC